MLESKNLALRIAAAAKEKLAQKLVILDMQKVASFCDYFVIVSATNLRQTNAIARGIQDDLDQVSMRPLVRPSPTDESGWVVLDFVSVVVHIFYKPMREFYALERLWSDAKRVRLTRSTK